jgi:hypothetical protein
VLPTLKEVKPPMDVDPKVIPERQSKLVRIDDLRSDVSDLDRQAADIANALIPSDADSGAQLIGGADASQSDKVEVQAPVKRPMNLDPKFIPELRSKLVRIDDLRSSVEIVTSKIGPANAAADRLRGEISDLDRQAADIANTLIPSDADRVAQLIGGAGVSQPDKEDVQARALKGHHIAAQRRQAAEDLAALQQHIGGLNAQVAGYDQQIVAVEAAFLGVLGDAVFDAYKRDATEFVAKNLPQLRAVARQLRSATGTPAHWDPSLFGGLNINWYEDEFEKDTQYQKKRVVLCQTSNQDIGPSDVLKALISDIRSLTTK